MTKTYLAADLADLCSIDRNNAGELVFDYDAFAYVFRADGLWLRLPDAIWNLTHAEQQAITGMNPRRLQRSDGELWGKAAVFPSLENVAPILPFPFTALQLWDFDRDTGSKVVEYWCRKPCCRFISRSCGWV
ncbi:hypothetical protein [Comamonas badia]|jgi:hypothetical protein|uniref:hypothetical protein n=1 Tax=Comamonas badia TaxID=265291 RepID=UPI000462E916|nr:hypothetical protein [Comamonas badia]